MPPEPAGPAGATEPVDPRAWRVLGVLMLVYVLNFVDRQLLTILAPDLKRELGIGDSEFGFLYGTAFGVFYALFGVPLGKLADRWSRVRLLTAGLALWSTMTALSGLSRNFAQVALARVGVGIGEATAGPCAYSLISDWFPPHRRATAIGVYSSGLYIGGGVSLFLGASIVEAWNRAFAPGTAPFGLAGWQAAFIAVGLPGLLLALLVSRMREPVRGRYDAESPSVAPEGSPWRNFFVELADVIPPLTLIGAARRGRRALAENIGAGLLIALAMAALVRLTGDWPQWLAFGLGCYAVASWLFALRRRDQETFTALARSPAFVCVTLGYSLVSFVGYASTGFTPLYAIEVLGADPKAAGLVLGGLGALGGSLGVIAGGAVADRRSRSGRPEARVEVVLASSLAAMVLYAVNFTAQSLTFFYAVVPVAWFFSSATLGAAAGVVVNIVRPGLRGTATAVFLLGTNLLGLALGPYTAGKMSGVLGNLGAGMLSLLVVVPATVGLLAAGIRHLRKQA